MTDDVQNSPDSPTYSESGAGSFQHPAAPLRVAIGLGANLDEPVITIRRAGERLKARGLRNSVLSSFYITTPVNCRPGTPDFVNAALIGKWPGSPDSLLEACRATECELGRPANHAKDEARMIDLDILMIANRNLRSENLIVPHPELNKRLFVLIPLAEIAGEWNLRMEGENRTINEWAEMLKEKNPGFEKTVRRLEHGSVPRNLDA